MRRKKSKTPHHALHEERRGRISLAAIGRDVAWGFRTLGRKDGFIRSGKKFKDLVPTIRENAF